ncbi:discoidin domain-containing protein [Phytomonospora sp. NPDC050363]|uniref:galactose-binding domain-containing protein n=1 Tax=Phytomonospora sp. NPDC050363 TaxID=3155642 RepID=UPI003402F061
MRSKRNRRLLAVAVIASLLLPVAPLAAEAAGGPNVASGKPVSVSSTNAPHSAGNLVDGDQGTLWESARGAFPAWATVDLGSVTSIDQIVLRLPAGWGTRTQTLSVQGSPDGTAYSTILASAEHTFSPSATIAFPPFTTRYIRVDVTANSVSPAAQIAEVEVRRTSTASANLALGKTVTAKSHADVYVAGNANDGQQASYWESANNAFPQWLQVDLGSAVAVNQLVLKIPSGWGARTQTLAVRGSTNGTTFTDIVASAGHVFGPAATINFNAATVRHVRLEITANTGWPAGQIAEFEVYGPGTGDTQAPTAPSSLAYTQPGSGQIRLTWNASSDNVGVTGYDVYANGTLRTTVNGSTLTYTDTQPATATVAYYIQAKDAAGNISPSSNTVTRNGSGGDTQAPTAPSSLAYTQPGSGQIRLTWNASSDNVGVTGYDVYANGSVRGSVNGSTLTYTDTQPATATVAYYVRARDAAGNASTNSNTVTRNGSGGTATNLAVGRPVTESGHAHTFVAANAVDDNTATYWESDALPGQLTVQLGANAVLDRVVVKLSPDSAWGSRTQNITVLGRDQGSTAYTTLVGAANYTFNPATANTVTIPLTATTADLRLSISSNTGAPGGQVAELQVFGVPAPNPDLTVTGISASPASPVESDSITLSATVANIGDRSSGATNVNFYLGTQLAGTANVAGLAAGAQTTVSASIGTKTAGSYQLTAKVDEADTVVEKNQTNNNYTRPAALVVAPVQSSDLVASVAWSPGNPTAGNAVAFTVTVRNQGTVNSAGGAHGITLTVRNESGATVRTLTGSVSGVINAGASASPVNLGTWTAANGRYTIRVVIAADANELPVKQGNNTSDTSLFVGRGANLPYDMYESEDGVTGGGATTVGPNRTIGDLAGEASGRKAVTLNGTGSYVQWTTKAPTNTLVTRFSIPDSAGGTGTTSNLSIYVNGVFHKNISLTSKYAWLYGAEASPGNSPGMGAPRHLYDEANILLDSTVPQGSTIRLQRDNGQSVATIDFVNLELVAPRANPDPARYKVPAGFTHQDVQNALDAARQDTGSLGVYLPAGVYSTATKFTVYGRAINVIGAGSWYTRFETPQGQENTNAGFDVPTSANGSRFEDLAFFGNYTSRIDGPGKVWGEMMNSEDLTINRVWVEHTIVGYWGVHNDNITITNSRFRNTFADGINFTNDTTNSLISNNEGRGNGDDAFALFSATDSGGSVGNHGNVFENLSATVTWRAAGLAVYGGYDNVFRNLYIADMLTYSGITISSLNFGYPFVGFGTTPTRFENISLIRAGGHFWGNQTFGAIWCFSASKEFRGIRISDVDIIDPTYSGIMFQTKYPEKIPVTDTLFTNVRISGAHKSGDAFDAKSGFGIWVNEMPEEGQGPAIGSATFTGLVFSDNFQNIKNTTTTFTLNIN